MHKLEFTLKQHTPLIHFQHDQAGATLRATEVKPKLDFFIMKKQLDDPEIPDNEVRNRFREIALKKLPDGSEHKWKNWLVGNGDHAALDYKMKISGAIKNNSCSELINVSLIRDKQGFDKLKYQNLPGFFGNMMKVNEFIDKEKTVKKVNLFDRVSLQLLCYSVELKNEIKKHVEEFFFIHNFGTRQTKGFGSFFLDTINPPSGNFLFFNLDHPANKFKDVFFDIDLFYRCLKGGLNLKGDGFIDKLYYKSLMFQYAKSISQQWDKRTIRHHQFLNHCKYNDEKFKPKRGILNERKTSETVNTTFSIPKNGNYFDFRDLLGLSSEQDWIFYKAKITKTVTYTGYNDKGEEEIFEAERFNSPITFKPIFNHEQKKWNVYIILKSIPNVFLGANVEVRRNDLNPQNLTIYNPFDLSTYLNFAINKFNERDIVYGENYDFEHTDEAQIITGIFNQLKKQINNEQ